MQPHLHNSVEIAGRYDDHLVSNPDDAGALFEYWAQPVMARWSIGMLSEVRLASVGAAQSAAVAIIGDRDMMRASYAKSEAECV